jgi:hypothetical protein
MRSDFYQELCPITSSNHVHTNTLTWLTHHGKNKLRFDNGQRPPDIVFTTYQTVESERRRGETTVGSIFSHYWKRIILDEGSSAPTQHFVAHELISVQHM